jgi:hypothetical protein
MWMRRLLGCALVCAAGCGGPRLATVTGKVTLDGTPLAGATVSFYPIGQPADPADAVASTGTTDDNGEYSLETTKDQRGAVVGTHRVSISLVNAQVGDNDERRPRRRGRQPLGDKVPARYNDKTELTFEVKPGSNRADWELKSR